MFNSKAAVVVNLLGGLGNQLFQYSAARSLSIQNNLDLILNKSEFNHYKLRKYELDVFSIEQNFFPTYKKWFSKYLFNQYREPHFNFDSNFFKIHESTEIYGYFQSEKYFHSIQSTIRDDLRFKRQMNSENIVMSEMILKSKNSISLHVRRADFVHNAQTNKYHGVCPISYYTESMKLLEQKLGNELSYFIFSDDIDWVKKNIQINSENYYVEHNGAENAAEDLRLMSLCKHQIIANSSFSWWGAWLNTNPNKIVISPQQYFTDARIDVSDLRPKSWILL